MNAGLKHLVFIVNPRSGTDRVKAIQAAIEAHLDHQQYSYELQTTERPRHGTELARNAAHQGAFAVVAVGGDGSINDIVAGLLDSDTALAIIPKGSGNGLARSMQIPLDVTAAIAVINRGRQQAMDVGFAGDHPFVSNAGVAFDALISRKFAKSEKRGLRVYSWLVTRHLWTYKIWDWEIVIDGERQQQKAFMISIANGRQFGYDFKIAPDASWTDGLLDVVIVKPFPKLLGGMLVLRALQGTLLKSMFVTRQRARHIRISHPELRLLQVDGDAHPCRQSVEFHVRPGALRVLVP